MILTTIMFVVALCLSAVAAFYSIVGLAAIFAAAVTPIILMGSILEVAKLAVTVWLHEYWLRCRWLMKAYLSVAVLVLMLITSMGIFGFLSKAHSDQSLVSGDVTSKIALYDEKIRIARENIDANRRALKQLDASVDQTLSRSTTESGAERSVQIRRQQGPERTRLLRDIETEQKKIAQLNEERAPIAAEVRKVEAEVGPIKYIAALIYGDNPEANLLERAVRWVIILIVFVFDPLAIMMLLAATESRKWGQEEKSTPAYEHDDGPLGTEQLDQIKASVDNPHPPDWKADKVSTLDPIKDNKVEEMVQEFDRSQHEYLHQPFVHFKDTKPMVASPNASQPSDDSVLHSYDNEDLVTKLDKIQDDELSEDSQFDTPEVKIAKSKWKKLNPNDTLKNQRQLLERGLIDRLPWLDLIEPTAQATSFGKTLPGSADRGDIFINTEFLPTRVFKYNGEKWIEVDKDISDSYVHDSAYIDHLISQVSSGEYDPELLTNAERSQIESRLRKDLS